MERKSFRLDVAQPPSTFLSQHSFFRLLSWQWQELHGESIQDKIWANLLHMGQKY